MSTGRNSTRNDCDVLVIGGGIVGLATAWQCINARPGTRVIVVEKEDRVAAHQSGHNSGVLHSGIYYKPGSLKATNCRRGHGMMIAFCQEHGISHDVCGKVIVATSEEELPALERIGARGRDNGIACTDIGPEQLKEIEPNCAGIRAIQVHDAGIADYVGVCEKLASLIEGAGGEVVMGSAVEKVRTDDECVRMSTSDREFTASAGVNCAGLHSDRVAELSGIKPEVRILPFRGEYFVLRPEAEKLVNNLIYPVPDPRYPFLGVHYTRMIKGGIECGPNAVLALSREGYTWEIGRAHV